MSAGEVERLPLTPLETQAVVADIRAKALDLAEALRDATDAGVSHALILPQLLLVFRETFGSMPDGFAAQLAGLGVPS